MLKLGEKSIKSLYLGGKSYAKAYLGSKLVFNKIKKPYYCEVEYIESTGTQYIDTGIIGNSDTKAELALIISTLATGNVGVFGSRGNSANSNLLAIGYGTSQLASDFNNSSYSRYRASVSYELDTKYICYTSKEERFIKDENGIVLAENTTLCNDTISTSNLLLFAETGVALKQQGKMFYVKIWDDNILVRDFIPVLDFNMKPCMYDKVSGKFFYNQGSGEFLYGREIHEVEYIESDGNQYIDTEYNINTETDEVELNYQLLDETVYKWLFGEHDNNARFALGSGDGTNKRNLAYGANTIKLADTYFFDNKHNFKANKEGVFVDGIKFTDYKSFTSTSSIWLFGLNLSPYTYGSKTRIWGYRHKRNGSLIRDYIPAIDESGKGFMFDRISHTIFDNQGSGEFINGKIVEK